MAAGEGEDVVGFAQQLRRDPLGAVLGNVTSQLTDCGDRMGAGGLAIGGSDACGCDAPTRSSRQYETGDTLSHGGSAGVAGADEKQGLHSNAGAKVLGTPESVNGEPHTPWE